MVLFLIESLVELFEWPPQRKQPFTLWQNLQGLLREGEISTGDYFRGTEMVRALVSTSTYASYSDPLPHPPMLPVYEQPVVTRAIDNNRFAFNPTGHLLDNRSHVRQLSFFFFTFFHKNPSTRINFTSSLVLLFLILPTHLCSDGTLKNIDILLSILVFLTPRFWFPMFPFYCSSVIRVTI